VDAKHWFRFSASKPDFEKIMRGVAMQPPGNVEKIDFGYGAKADWWRIEASAIQWVHCARLPSQVTKPRADAILLRLLFCGAVAPITEFGQSVKRWCKPRCLT